MIVPKASDRLLFVQFLLSWLFFTLFSLAIQYTTGGFATDCGNHADEAAHFVSSLMIADYFAAGAPSSPMAFAQDYYLHYPKVAIGHWPPVFELTQALAFLIFGSSQTVAIALQALIAGLCAGLPCAFLWRRLGPAEGLLAGGIVLLSPVFLPMLDMVMADTLLAAFVTLAALAWSRFYHERRWRGALLFALAAAAAILTKGSGFGLVFLPLLYLAFRRDLAFLLNRKTLAAGALVAILTLPWYVLTYKMAADGFVYRWGWQYTKLAVPFFLRELAASLGFPGLLAFLIGFFFCWRHEKQPAPASDSQPDIAAFAATALAMLVFAMVAPADLDRRYLIPILPSAAIVAVWGLSRGMLALTRRRSVARPLVIAVLAGSLALVFALPHPRSLQSSRLVQEIMGADTPNPLVLVSGSVAAEGSVISSFAERDRTEKYYIIRAQKALARTNWMASDYSLKFTTPTAMADWIRDQKIGWIVLDQDMYQTGEFPHNALLTEVIAQNLLSATLVDTVAHPGGKIQLYSLPAAAAPAAMSSSLAQALKPGHLEDTP